MSLRDQPKQTLAKAIAIAILLIVPATASAVPVFELDFEGPTGDFISLGQHVTLTELDVGLTVSTFDATGDNLVDVVRFTSTGVQELFFLLFFDTSAIPANLVPGDYPDAQRSPFAAPGHPGFWLSWDHRGCNGITGSFSITEAVFGPSGPSRFSARFEQSCEGTMPPLSGTFTFADSDLTPAPEPQTLVLLAPWLVTLVGARVCRQRALGKRDILVDGGDG